MRKLILSLFILICLSAYSQINTNMDNNIVYSNSRYSSQVYPIETPSPTLQKMGPRRVINDPDDPYPEPIGDFAGPLILFSIMYLICKNRKKIGEQH